MSAPGLKRGLKILAMLALAAAVRPTKEAAAENCLGDPWFFCYCARAAAQQCWWDYEACGGFLVEGCSEAYEQCRLDSGIDQCQ